MKLIEFSLILFGVLLNAFAQLLLKAGVPGEMIEVRVQESERDNADNTKVVVRPAT